ncbi:MAG: aspartate 1-decarboxylase [Chloroflexi bacterium]|nr:MAG: aspartate 1-decarboxylase [Chloroflexota bacterium]
MLVSKIHRARVTGTDLNYIGSITIDETLMQAAGILAWELVQVADITNGARLETYVIPGDAGTGTVQINGAAAHLVQPGDLVIIMAFAWLDAMELERHHPKVILVDEQNRVVDVRDGHPL